MSDELRVEQFEGPTHADRVTRRTMVAGISTAALVTAMAGAQQSQSPASDTYSQNTSGGKPPTDPGPENKPIVDENPSSWFPPPTDSGDVNNFRFPFAFGHNRVSRGAGWARQVTVRDLMISKTLAGVNMRLEPGAVRELHWHVPAEWAFMLDGTARITGVDAYGHSQVSDVGPGDLWYFPGGVPHSIQGLEDGCEFLLVFDDGNFSEFDTFLITDWLGHTPPDVIAKNLSWPMSVVQQMHKKELYIFNAPQPKSLEEDQRAATGPGGAPPDPFDFKMRAMKPNVTRQGGEVRIVDSSKFKVSKTVAAALVTLKQGGLRELHWHPNADEWQYYTRGQGRMTVFIGGGKARTIDFHAGDVGYIQQSLPHYIENTGDGELEFMEIFRSDRYEDISLAGWISHLPPELVAAHLKIDESLIAKVPKEEMVIVPV
ncbi:MAG TPA: cupin domain-containing protein [Tepidisphaeraceae bacterium]